MSEEIELGGIKVPAADLEATPESIKLVLKFLVEERKQTLAKIEALEERVKKNSKNSSIPPSKNGFGVKNSHQVTAKRKPLKLQSRRVKQERKRYEVAECAATHEFKPSNCSSCGYELTGEDSPPTRHQVVDLPVLKPLITEYRLHQLECEHCGDKTRASLPSFVSPKCYGARLAAFVAMLSGESRQSHRQVKTFLSQVFGIELARGTINRMRQEISSAVATATTEAMEFTKQQPVVTLLRAGFHQELLSAAAIEIGTKETTPLAKTVRTCRKLLQVESALWTFVYHESIEPTNNSAERALRSAVIWRNLSFGSQSSEGSKFVARMLTVNCSLKAQGRSILDFLTESCIAARLGLETPSLIPMTQDEHVCAPPSTTLILS